MKHTLRKISYAATLIFAFAAAVQVTGLLAIPGVATSVLAIGLLVSGLLAFVLSSYTWKPAFRVRRPEADPGQPAAASTPATGEAGPDWTYSTKIK